MTMDLKEIRQRIYKLFVGQKNTLAKLESSIYFT